MHQQPPGKVHRPAKSALPGQLVFAQARMTTRLKVPAGQALQLLHTTTLPTVIKLQTFVKLIFRSKYIDFIELFIAANVINLSKPRCNAGLRWRRVEFCTKLSTKTVR
jgi:hypothetical protein